MRASAVCAALGAVALAVAGGADQAVAAFNPVEVVDRAINRDLKKKKKKHDKNDPYSPNFRVKSERSCVKPAEDRDNEDRYCESTFKPDSTCGCKEVCHIWGDPHVSPFFSGCSEVAMGEPGKYTAYKIPEDSVNWPERTPIDIEVIVKQFNTRYKFVRNLLVNGTEVFSIGDCKDDMSALFNQEYPVFDNSTHQVLVGLHANCNARHETHLNVTVVLNTGNKPQEVSDSLQSYLADIRETYYNGLEILNEDNVPLSTTIFPDDYGVCTDPLKYSNTRRTYGKNPFWLDGEDCKRPSGFDDGADCTCSSQCAAYGDPHMYDFPRKQELGNDFLADVEDPTGRVLYSIGNRFAAVVGIDECAYIRNFFAVYGKESIPEGEESNPSHYEVVTYNASTLCADDKVMGKGRTIIRVPEDVVHPRRAVKLAATDDQVAIAESNIKYYDPTVSGFNIGTYVSFTNGDLDLLPAGSSVEQVAAGRTVSEVITSGGVQVILKCHITKEEKGKPGRKYFNVCIERNGIAVDLPDFGDSGRKLGGKEPIEDGNIRSLLDVEKSLRTGGWCATGKQLGKNKYERRTADEIDVFPFNPEVVKSETCQSQGTC